MSFDPLGFLLIDRSDVEVVLEFFEGLLDFGRTLINKG